MPAKPPKSETVVSWLLLTALAVVLVLVGTGVFRSAPAGSSAGPGKAAVAYKLPAGWTLAGDWEVYPNGKLYEKIDGQEVLFYQYGVNRLECATAALDNQSFDIYVYHMKEPDAALGVYLAQASSDFTELDLGTLSDLSGGQVRALLGSVYLEVMPQEKKVDPRRTKDLARAILAAIPPEKTTTGNVFNRLPLLSRVKGSLAINRESAFGLKSLANTFSASYDDGKTQFDCLVRKMPAEQGARVLEKTGNEMKDFDGKVLNSGPTALTGQLLGKTLMLIVKNGYLCGIYGDITLDEAKARLDRLATNLKEGPDGRK